MPMSQIHRRRMLLEVCRHEARHCGFFHTCGITVHQVTVDESGNGVTSYGTLESTELAALYHVDRTAAFNRVVDYVSGCLSGHLTTQAMPDRVDLDQADHYAAMWSKMTKQPAAPVLDRAQRHAIAWIIANRRPIEAFARALDVRRSLRGAELEALLHHTFGPSPQSAQPSTPAPRPAPALRTADDAAKALERLELFYGLARTRKAVQTPRRAAPSTALEGPPLVPDWRTGWSPFLLRGVGRVAPSW
jgi:hypothetical protein